MSAEEFSKLRSEVIDTLAGIDIRCTGLMGVEYTGKLAHEGAQIVFDRLYATGFKISHGG